MGMPPLWTVRRTACGLDRQGDADGLRRIAVRDGVSHQVRHDLLEPVGIDARREQLPSTRTLIVDVGCATPHFVDDLGHQRRQVDRLGTQRRRESRRSDGRASDRGAARSSAACGRRWRSRATSFLRTSAGVSGRIGEHARCRQDRVQRIAKVVAQDAQEHLPEVVVAASVVDVRVRAEPAHDAAVGVVERLTRVKNHRNTPSAPRSGNSISNGSPVSIECCHRSTTASSFGGIVDRLPAPALHLFERSCPCIRTSGGCSSRRSRPGAPSMPAREGSRPARETGARWPQRVRQEAREFLRRAAPAPSPRTRRRGCRRSSRRRREAARRRSPSRRPRACHRTQRASRASSPSRSVRDARAEHLVQIAR